jgi:hypothetical protein
LFKPEKKKKNVVEDTIDWLLTHDPSPEELDDGVMMDGRVSNLSGVKLPDGANAKCKRQEEESIRKSPGNGFIRKEQYKAMIRCGTNRISKIPIPKGGLSPKSKVLLRKVWSGGEKMNPLAKVRKLRVPNGKTYCHCCTKTPTSNTPKIIECDNPAEQLVDWLRDNTFNPADLMMMVMMMARWRGGRKRRIKEQQQRRLSPLAARLLALFKGNRG